MNKLQLFVNELVSEYNKIDKPDFDCKNEKADFVSDFILNKVCETDINTISEILLENDNFEQALSIAQYVFGRKTELKELDITDLLWLLIEDRYFSLFK